MRTQQLLVLAGIMLASNLAIAARLEHDDVPKRCWDSCGSVANKASECDARHDKDSAELDCICKWEPAKTQVPLCVACISQYEREHDHDDHDNDDDDDDFDDDNDALDIVHSCRFTTTSYNSPAATTLRGSSTGTTTTPTTASITGSGDSGSTGNGSQGSSGSAGGASSPTPTNDAAGLSAPGALSMAALAGLMPLAWL